MLILGFPLLLIPPMFAFGWAIDYGRSVARGDARLPPFRGRHFWDGLRLGLALAVYYLPVTLLFAPFIMTGLLLDPEAASRISFAFVLPSIMAQLYGLAVSAITPAIYAVYIAEGTFEACFSPRRLGYVMRSRGWTYVGVAAVAYGIASVSGVGVIACLVGVVFTVFYALVVNFHLAGQLARPIVMPAMTNP